jgi:hypothetical protein
MLSAMITEEAGHVPQSDGEKESLMRKLLVKRMKLNRETLHQLEEVAESRQLRAPVGGAWPVTTVHPYPCQPSCLCN